MINFFTKTMRKIIELKNLRIIFDLEKQVNIQNQNKNISYTFNLNKDQIARDYILKRNGQNMKFLDIGGRDGELTYLLGISNNLHTRSLVRYC